MKHFIAWFIAFELVVLVLGAFIFIMTNEVAKDLALIVCVVALLGLIAAAFMGKVYNRLFGDDGTYE